VWFLEGERVREREREREGGRKEESKMTGYRARIAIRGD